MRRAACGTLFVLAAAPLSAQDSTAPRFELGAAVRQAWHRTPSLPTIQGWDLGLYGDLAITDRLGLSSSVSTSGLWVGSESTQTQVDVRWLFRGTDRPSPYVFGGWTMDYLAETPHRDRMFSHAAGGGAGIRFPLASRLAVSLEADYRRWIGRGKERVGFGMRVGVPFGRR